MRTIVAASLAVLLASLAVPAEAKPSKDPVREAKLLLARLRGHEPKQPKQVADAPLLQFLPSPRTGAVQGQGFTVLIESINNFPGRILTMDYSLNGGATQSAPLVDNLGLFAAYLGTQNLVSTNTLDATLYAENSANNTDLRTAIKNLDTSIKQLTTQINAARDPVTRATLEEQRSEQIALKQELVTELRAFRVALGTQRFTYTVAADSGSATNPKIASLNPISGDVRGGTIVTISGANFSSPVSAKFGGIASPSVSLVDAQTIRAVTPDFGAGHTGAKDLELTFGALNAVSPGAFFAETITSAPLKPVAIAAGSAKIQLGQSDQLDGTQSYGRVSDFRYAWTVVSAPLNSNYAIGQSVGSAPAVLVTPSTFGTYVFQLVVTENSTAEHLVSDPSIAVVQVGGAPQPTASALSLFVGATATTQINPNDPVIGEAVTYAISSLPLHGTARVSPSGLVTYTSTGTDTTPDSLGVIVTGQSGLFGTVTIPVSFLVNHAPFASAPPITTQPGVAATSQVNAFDLDPGQTVSYALTTSPTNGTATLSPTGLVTYTPNNGFAGNDSIVVTVKDSVTNPLSTSVTIPVVVSSLTPPNIPNQIAFRMSLRGNPISAAMSVDPALATGITYQNGGAASVLWDFGDGTKELSTDLNFASMSHFYASPGKYNVTVTAKDKAGLTSSRTITAQVIDEDPPVAKFRFTPSTGGAAPLTVTFDASESTYSGTIGQYRWLFCGRPPELVTTTPTITQTFTTTCSARLTVMGADGFARAFATATVNVGAAVAGAAPVSVPRLAVGARELVLGTPHALDGLVSFDPNVGGTITGQNWNFNDASCTTNCTSSAVSTSHTYSFVANFAPTLTVTNAFGLTNTLSTTLFVITSAGTHSPRAILTASTRSGPAPLTVNFDLASQSYAYNFATISGYRTNFADGSADSLTGASTHTFTNPGTYLVVGSVTDSDGNRTFTSTTISVTSGRDAAPPRDGVFQDPEREQQRQNLTLACSQGDGASCYALSQMFADDGDAYTAGQLATRACSDGYQPACH
jgi:PKD repeat protein